MTDEQLRALIIAILMLDQSRGWEQISGLALEADEIIQAAKEPFFHAKR